MLPRPAAADAGPRLGCRRGRLLLLRRVLAQLSLPGRALAPGARHGRGRVRHVPRAAPGVAARGRAPRFRRRAEVPRRERAEAGRVVRCVGVRRLQPLPLVETPRRWLVVVDERRGARARLLVVAGVPARDPGRPAPELARVHLHDPRAAIEAGVAAVGQPAAVHRRHGQWLHAARNVPLLCVQTRNEEKLKSFFHILKFD